MRSGGVARGADTLVGKEAPIANCKVLPKSAAATGRKPAGFTNEERAIREHLEELKADARGGKRAARRTEKATCSRTSRRCLSRIAPWLSRFIIIKANGPGLSPRTWHGMPAKDGNVVCFFQSGQKFKTRYATLGFSDKAKLDEGQMWPTAFALKELTAGGEARIGALVKRAAS